MYAVKSRYSVSIHTRFTFLYTCVILKKFFSFFLLTVFTRKYTRGTRIDASVAVGFYFVLVLRQPTIVTALHGNRMQTRSSDVNSVCLSVRLSVKRDL